MGLVKFFFNLTKSNWGWSFHWIEMVLPLFLIFGGLGVTISILPIVAAIIFLYRFIVEFIELKNGQSWQGMAQDLLADIHGLLFFLYAFPMAENISHWFFWIATIIMSAALYYTERH